MPVTGIFQPDPLWSALAAVLVLLVPGWLVLTVLPSVSHRPQWDVLAGLADAAALSVAISALFGLWLFVPGLRLNSWVLAALYTVCLLFGLVQLLRRGWPQPGWKQVGLALLALGLVLAMVTWRLYQARGLALPAWVDSVHHVLIVRVIGEYGGVPPTLGPYLPVPFYYHYGFHLVAALFAFWAHLTPEQAVLWLGQVINALVALSVYRLGSAIFPAAQEPAALRWMPRGLLAALLVAFAFQMPAYYLSWGRYTLLTGLLVLGPAMAAALEVWRDPHDRSAAIRLALLLAGLCVVHYLALLLMGIFLLVLGLFGVLRAFGAIRTQQGRFWRALPWTLIAASTAGLLLAAPWLWRVIAYNLALLGARLALPAERALQLSSLGDQFEYLLFLVGPWHSHVLLILAGIGFLFALRKPCLRAVMVWTALLLVLDLPWGLRLGPFRPDHYAIVLFFPAALFLADLLVSAAEALGRVRLAGRRLAWVSAGCLLLAVAGLLTWGLRETRSVVNSGTNLVTTSDVAALEWVKANTQPTARFYINSVVWQAPTYRGVDGGYWLLPYTGRASLVPPALYMLADRVETKRIANWAQRSATLNGCPPELWDLIRSANLTHLYLREGVGSLQPDELANCPRLRPVYQRGGVFIYEVPAP